MELKAWDIELKTLITDIDFPPYAECAFRSGKLYVADVNSISRKNFLS